MANALRRDPFDPDRNYVVAAQMKFRGEQYAPGSAFPQETVTLRKLRQLYDTRYLKMAPERDELPKSFGPDFSVMSMDELRDWLKNHGLIARLNWDRQKLIDKAQAIASD